MKKALAIAIAAILSGCASDPANISAASVSPMQYNGYDCAQVVAELDRVTKRANELNTSLKDKADNDSTQMALGMVIFWPALFFLEGGDGPEAAEYARLKGEKEAIEKTAIAKNCALPPPPEPALQPAATEQPEPL